MRPSACLISSFRSVTSQRWLLLSYSEVPSVQPSCQAPLLTVLLDFCSPWISLRGRSRCPRAVFSKPFSADVPLGLRVKLRLPLRLRAELHVAVVLRVKFSWPLVSEWKLWAPWSANETSHTSWSQSDFFLKWHFANFRWPFKFSRRTSFHKLFSAPLEYSLDWFLFYTIALIRTAWPIA